jgi:hypothetical protein
VEPLLQILKKLPLPIIVVHVDVKGIYFELLLHYLHKNNLELFGNGYQNDRRKIKESKTLVNIDNYTTMLWMFK